MNFEELDKVANQKEKEKENFCPVQEKFQQIQNLALSIPEALNIGKESLVVILSSKIVDICQEEL